MKLTYAIAALTAGLLVMQSDAQVLGLPVANDAAVGNTGDMAVSGGVVIGDDWNLYGGRFSYNPMNELEVFGGLGIVDPDRGDSGFGIQGGAQYALNLGDFPLDVGLRGTVGYANLDQDFGPTTVDIDIWTVTGGAVISHSIDEMFSLYGLLGLAYSRFSSSGYSDSETDPALGVGLLLSVTPQFSLYGEVMHIDDPWFGFGVRFDI